jgi:hypothetical protein
VRLFDSRRRLARVRAHRVVQVHFAVSKFKFFGKSFFFEKSIKSHNFFFSFY